MSDLKKPARQIVIETLKERPNELTRQDMCDKLNMKPAGLASVFTQLRLMGHFPMVDENGKLYMGTEEAYKASRTAKPKVHRSFEETRDALLRAKTNCENKMEKWEMADLESREFLLFKVEEARLALIEYDLEHLEESAEETEEVKETEETVEEL